MASSQLVLVVARLRPTGHDESAFLAAVGEAVRALRARPGHVSSRIGRALEDPQLWVLVSEWESVGSYRRALSSYDVRMAGGALFGAVIDEPTAFEEVDLLEVPPPA